MDDFLYRRFYGHFFPWSLFFRDILLLVHRRSETGNCQTMATICKGLLLTFFSLFPGLVPFASDSSVEVDQILRCFMKVWKCDTRN